MGSLDAAKMAPRRIPTAPRSGQLYRFPGFNTLLTASVPIAYHSENPYEHARDIQDAMTEERTPKTAKRPRRAPRGIRRRHVLLGAGAGAGALAATRGLGLHRLRDFPTPGSPP